MLPTESQSNIWSHKGRRLYFNQTNFNDIDDEIRYHLYITSDDEIKDGDWCIMFDSIGNIFSTPQQYKPKEGHILNDGLKKIIATTDSSLMHLSNNGRVGYNLPQPSQSFIKKYCELGGNIDKVLVEYESKGCILKNGVCADYLTDECKDEGYRCYKLKTDSHNTITIKPVKDSWTREEVIDLLKQYQEDFCNFESIKPGLEKLKNTINLPEYWRDWINKNL